MKIRLFFVLIFTMAFTFPFYGQIDYNNLSSEELAFNSKVHGNIDIIGIATSLDEFSTLVKTLRAADLLNTLKGEGPFTVFAPVNTAFGKLPAGTVENLLKPEQKEQLKRVLSYHVVSTKVLGASLVKAIRENDGKYGIATIGGEKLRASIKDGNVVLSGTKGNFAIITKADVIASNGVIHVIDTVVLPE